MSFKGMKRLSVQSLGPDDRVLDAVRRGKPAVFKAVDPDPGWVQKLHDASPGTVLIGRIVDDSLAGKLSAPEGRTFAERVLRKADELGDLVMWWEGSNEAASDPESIKRLCEFERAFAERIQAEGPSTDPSSSSGGASGQGYHALVGGFSSGVPQIVGPDTEVPWMGEWELFYPAMEVAHGVHFREYWHPYQLNGTWNAYRFEKWWPALPEWAKAKWWLVGELGVDGGLAGEGRRGWRHYMSADRYQDLLKCYAETMARYPRLAATVFIAGCGTDTSWATFDICGEVLERVSAEWSAAPLERWGMPVEEEVAEEEVIETSAPLVAAGARNLIDQLPVREGTEGYTGRRGLDDIDIFVVHWLGARGRNLRPETVWREQTTHQDTDRPKFPAGAYHFQITQDGTLTQLHRLTTVTWQSAGTDEATGRALNDICVAVVIEPEREGDQYRYKEGQISACLALYDWLCRRLGRQLRVAGHYEVRPPTPEGLPSTECPGPAWSIQLKPLLEQRDPHRPPLPRWEEAARVAWHSLIVSHNPDFALPQKAMQVLGPEAFALSDEAYFALGGTTWVRQLWSDGVEVKMLLAIKDQWDLDEIQVVPVPAVRRLPPPRRLPLSRRPE